MPSILFCLWLKIVFKGEGFSHFGELFIPLGLSCVYVFKLLFDSLLLICLMSI